MIPGVLPTSAEYMLKHFIQSEAAGVRFVSIDS